MPHPPPPRLPEGRRRLGYVSSSDEREYPKVSPGGIGPEQTARIEINKALAEAGWIVQNREDTNLVAGQGVAIRFSACTRC